MPRRGTCSTTILSALLVLVAWQGPDPVRAASPDAVGRWLPPFSEDGIDDDDAGDFDERPPATRSESARLPTAVNTVVLADGRILYWSQLDGTEAVDFSIGFQRPHPARSRTRVLDLSSYYSTGSVPPPASAWSTPSPEDGGGGDLVGSEQRQLSDGGVLAIGGTEWANDDAALGLPNGFGRTELYGSRNARVFDPANRTWTQAPHMHRGRYYPTLVTLPGGDLAAFGGVGKLVYNTSLLPAARRPAHAIPENVREPEIYDSAAGTWSLDERPAAKAALPPFARLHVLPNGRLLYTAVGMLFPPGGADREQAEWNAHKWFDPATRTWSDAGPAPLGVRSNAFSVLLPLAPPYDRAEVLIGGGTAGQWPGGHVATPLTEIVTWDARSATPDRPARRLASPLTTGRWHSSAVVLPTGEVVALSGADKDEVVDPGSGVPVRHAEMYDPATGTWRRLAEAARDRTLHNTAVLLRDGSILVGGHSPAPAHYGNHTSNPRPLSNNFKDPSFEIFRPPALFRGPRPVISGLSTMRLRRAQAFRVETADAADPTLRVVLSRLPATTHVTDADQRTVVLEHRAADGTSVVARVPDSASVVPPGAYYLFLVKDNGKGPTPSVAEIVRVER